MTTLQLMPTVDRSPPPSEQIATYYRDAIRTGRLAPGDELPANRRLAAEWQVSTATALRAVAMLRQEGLVITRPGRPPLVAERPPG